MSKAEPFASKIDPFPAQCPSAASGQLSVAVERCLTLTARRHVRVRDDGESCFRVVIIEDIAGPSRSLRTRLCRP